MFQTEVTMNNHGKVCKYAKVSAKFVSFKIHLMYIINHEADLFQLLLIMLYFSATSM